MTNQLSKAEKLLSAAASLATDGQDEFTVEDLIVRVHRLFPSDFALKGYPQYPDSNAVLTKVFGISAPVIVRGWVEKTGTKKYRVTPKGVHDLAELTERPDDQRISSETAVSIERRQDESIGRLLTSTAFDLFKQGRADETTFHQFCRFVGLSARDKWQRVSGRLEAVRHLTEEARRLGESGQSLQVYLEHNYTFTSEDLRLLSALYEDLRRRFRAEMDQWRRHAT